MPRKIESQEQRNAALEYGRAWYKKNAERVKARKESRKDEIQVWYRDFKSRLKCQHCGENDPAALDFHHRDPRTKEMSLARAIHNGWSIERILQEVAKCDVLCANCHARLHASLK